MWSRWRSPTTTRAATGKIKAITRSAGIDARQLSLKRRRGRAECEQHRGYVERVGDAAERIVDGADQDRPKRRADTKRNGHGRDRGRPRRGRIVEANKGGGRADDGKERHAE